MKNLRHLDQAALRTLMDQLSEKPFKAAQIHDWLWKKNISSIEEMSVNFLAKAEPRQSDHLHCTIIGNNDGRCVQMAGT